MRNVEDVLRNIRFGSVIKIYKEIVGEEPSYYGCMIKYDGRIFKDVEVIKVLDFLKNNPYIMNVLDKDNYLRLTYDSNDKKYQSAIVHVDKIDFNTKLEQVDLMKNYISSTLDESIDGLNNLIKYINRNTRKKVKKIS